MDVKEIIFPKSHGFVYFFKGDVFITPVYFYSRFNDDKWEYERKGVSILFMNIGWHRQWERKQEKAGFI